MVERYFEARKIISSDKKGEYEINKVHVIKLENEDLLNYFYDYVEDNDDYEGLYFEGFVMSWDDLYSVDVDKALKIIEDKISEINDEKAADQDGYEEGFLEKLENYREWLKKYPGYDLIIKEKEEKK